MKWIVIFTLFTFSSIESMAFCFHNHVGGYRVKNNSSSKIHVVFAAGGCVKIEDGTVTVCKMSKLAPGEEASMDYAWGTTGWFVKVTQVGNKKVSIYAYPGFGCREVRTCVFTDNANGPKLSC